MSGPPPTPPRPYEPPPEQPRDQPHTGITRRSAGWLVGLFVVIAIAAVMTLVHLPYAILKPGPVTNTLGNGSDGKPLITVVGSQTYPTTGTLDFTTVALYGGPDNPVNVWDVLGGLLDRSSQVVPEDQLFPTGSTSQQVQQENTAEMVSSQQEAVAVALRALGKTVPEVVQVAQVEPDAPSGAVLKAGDVILAVDGVPASTPDAIRSAIQKHKPGESVQITVRRGATEQKLTARTGSSQGSTVLGVLLRTSFDFPVKVTINAGDVGGPSAGMMFSLGVYDKLTPGALTGGAKIAGTGTIDDQGNVGPIGGIQQKLVGARSGGAAWFLAPAANCNDVVAHVPDGLHVVKVSTFNQAKDAVTAIAAGQTSGLASCSGTAAAK